MSDSKASKLRLPSKIGRPCCTVPPKPALPPSPPRSTMNSMEPLWEVGHGRRISEDRLRRGSDTSVVLTDDTDSFIIGDRVWVGGTKPGSIAYIGETQFAPGDWAGVVLDETIGKNDGSVAGSRYFQCEPKRGIFSRLTRLTREPLTDTDGGRVSSPKNDKISTGSPAETSRHSLNKSMSPSLNASTTSLTSVSCRDLNLGDRVIVSSSQGSKTGVLRFVGTTEFAAGEWCGVELDDPVGKNDGCVGEIRYFECRPKHGLFAPMHKVSRSPSSRRTSGMCVIHKPTGASMSSSLRRIGGSRESLASMSSIASTNASIATRGTTGTRRPGLHSATPVRSSMQETLKEKQQEIDMLRKERDFERNRISKAATQANNAEQAVVTLKHEYDKYREDMEEMVREAQASLVELLEEKNTLKVQLEEEKQKSEDLLFRFEEESVNKDDIQTQSTDQHVINKLNQSKLEELEKRLSEERERVIQLENENTKLFEAEEEIVKLRAKLSSAVDHEQKDLQDIQNRNLCLEEAKITLEKQMLERNDLIEQYVTRIKEFEDKLSCLESENLSRANVVDDFQKNTEKIQLCLAEKSELIAKIKKDHEIDTETLKKEIQKLNQLIENITNETSREKESLAEEHRKLLAEKESTILLRTEELETMTKRHEEIHRNALDKLRADNIECINELSENFKKQFTDKDTQIKIITNQLEEKTVEIEDLVKNLTELRAACSTKDEELQQMLERYEELNEKYKQSEKTNIELTIELNNLRMKTEECRSSFIQEKQKLEESVASLLAASGDSSTQLEKLNQDLKTKEKELSALRDAKAAEIEELKKSFETQIESKTRYITEISADMSQQSLRLSALEKEIANLNEIISNKDEEIKNLLEKNTELRDTITLSDETKTNLESELRMYDVNIAALNLKLSRAEEKSSQLVEHKIRLETEIANVISTSTNSSDQLLKYSEELRAKEKQIDELRENLLHLENLKSSEAAKLVTTIEELGKSKEIANKLSIDVQQLEGKMNASETAKTALNIEINELKLREQKQLTENQETKEKLDREVELKTEEITKLEERNRKMQEEVVNLSEKYLSLEKATAEREKEIENVNESLKNEIASLSGESKRFREISESLQLECTKTDENIKQMQQNIDAENETKKKLESTLMEKNAEVERLEEKITAIKKDRDEANLVARSNSEKYNESLTKIALLTSSQTNADSERSLVLQNLRDQLTHTESNCQQLTGQLEDREKSVNELNVKLTEYVESLKARENEKLELSKCLKEAEISMENLKERTNDSEKELNEKLDTSTREKSQLVERVKEFENKFNEVQQQLESKIQIVNQFEKETEKLKNDFKDIESFNGNKDLELENVSKRAKNAEEENEELRKKMISFNDDLTAKDILCQKMKKEIENLRENQAKTANSEKLERESELKAKDAKIVELDRETEDLRIAKDSIEKALNGEREKIKSLSKLLEETEVSAAKNSSKLEEKLNLEKSEIVQLKEYQNRLEKENKQILGKLNEALEDKKTLIENKRNNQEIEHYPNNQKIQSAGGDMNQNSDRQDKVKEITEENEMYKGQIDFLNSVIVDMQRKNETLLCKIEVLEMGVPANEADDYNRSTLDKRLAAPRMFCDICDQFDLHETEDCPRQAQDFSEPEQKAKNPTPKKPSVERAYCENCEMFGHDTLDCDDAETF